MVQAHFSPTRVSSSVSIIRQKGFASSLNYLVKIQLTIYMLVHLWTLSSSIVSIFKKGDFCSNSIFFYLVILSEFYRSVFLKV